MFNEVTDNVNQIISRQIQDEEVPLSKNLDYINTYSPLTRETECNPCPTAKPKCHEKKCVECLVDKDCRDPRLGTCKDKVCTTSCRAHNQCVHPAKLRCNFATSQCEGGDFLAAFTLNTLADTEIKKRMDNTEKGITNAQTSGTSVAQIYGDTR